EIDRRFARHEDEGTRQSLDVPELDPHDVGAAARHLSRSKGQILGQEHLWDPDAVVSIEFLRSRAGRECEDERAQQDRDCSSGVCEPGGGHDSSPGSSLHGRSWDRPTGRRVARPRWRSALDEQTPCRRVPLSSPAVNCPPSGRRYDPEETREAVGAAPADRAITRTLSISRNTVRKWLPCAAEGSPRYRRTRCPPGR